MGNHDQFKHFRLSLLLLVKNVIVMPVPLLVAPHLKKPVFSARKRGLRPCATIRLALAKSEVKATF